MPRECCLVLRKYATSVVFFKHQKMLKVRGERVFATVDRRSQEMPKLLFAGMGRCWRLKRGLHGLQQDLNFRGADGR